jgi:hypothetical protein
VLASDQRAHGKKPPIIERSWRLVQRYDDDDVKPIATRCHVS